MSCTENTSPCPHDGQAAAAAAPDDPGALGTTLPIRQPSRDDGWLDLTCFDVEDAQRFADLVLAFARRQVPWSAVVQLDGVAGEADMATWRANADALLEEVGAAGQAVLSRLPLVLEAVVEGVTGPTEDGRG